MNAVSVDRGKPWTVAREQRPVALEIVLLKQTYVLPWSQFLYAEGGADEMRLVFATHDVVVRGGGLEALLGDLSAQCVVAIREPSRAERFPEGSGRFIREIIVRNLEAEHDRR